MNVATTLKLLLVLLITQNSSTQNEGEFCRLEDGSNGTCTLITKCESATKALKGGELPQACGFVGTVIVACCRNNVVLPPRTSRRLLPTIPPPPPPPMDTKIGGRPVGYVSKYMCREYAQYAREKKEADTLSIITKVSNILECAFEKVHLINGGTLATTKEFPHMALLGYQSESVGEVYWNCGGSLISEDYVLTAGHCLYSQYGSLKVIRVGVTNLTDLFFMQELKVDRLIPHPEYIGRKYHDIALIKLASKVEMNPYARPACLFTEKQIPNSQAIASGWGIMEETGSPSRDLLKVVLELFAQEQCNNTYRSVAIEPGTVLDRGIVEDWMICAGSSKDFKDTCRGDSGGPLQIYHEDTEDIKCMYDIIGITSFGKGCGLAKNQPGVYTRVSNYIRWIEDTVWPEL